MKNEEIHLHLHVSWGIRGDRLDPVEVSRQLGIEPSHSFKKGDNYSSKDGRVHQRPSTVWQLRSSEHVQSADLDTHAEFILQNLEPRAGIVRKLRDTAEYSDVRIWYELETQGVNNTASFGLSASVLQRLAALADNVVFSVILNSGGLPE